MLIEKIEVAILSIPMKKVFRTAFGEIRKKETVIVKIYSEGLVGFGEAAALGVPIYNEESVVSCFRVIEKYIAPILVGKKLESPKDFVDITSFIIGNRIAKSGVESALWDIYSQRKKKPLYQLFGGTSSCIEVGESIGLQDNFGKTVEEITKSLERGYKRVKLKIKPGNDIKVLEKVRKIFPNIKLMVDANSAYSLKDKRDISALMALDKYDLQMVEQPLGNDDIVEHSTLARIISTPICLDESICSLKHAERAADINACKIINLKPGRVSGPTETIKIHNFAMENNIKVWCGGMLETGIGRAFNISLATLPNFKYPSDMSPSGYYFVEDLVQDPYEVDNGLVKVSQKLGLGYTVDKDRVKKYSVQRVEL